MKENELEAKRNHLLLDLLDTILRKCKQNNVEIRVLGGLAVFLKCPQHQELISKCREPFSDIDLITKKVDIEKVETFFENLDFEQNKNFKILFGYQRRIFYSPQNITIEVYLDDLDLCQEIKVSERLLLDYPTISITDLFLSKIQRIDLAEKDIFDIFVLLESFDFSGEKSNKIDIEYISELCSKSWGWWKTFKININKLYDQKKGVFKNANDINRKLKEIETAIDSKKKSIKWMVRNIIGENFNWFKTVDEGI